MLENKLWDQFWKTGRIEDYLNYKWEQGDAANEYQNQRSYTQQKELPREGEIPYHFE